MRTVVLQTRPLYEQHTSSHLADKLNEVVSEWKLERPGMNKAVTTDNARNIVNAIGEAGLGPHIACFAHTLNLAAKKALDVKQVSNVLAKMRSTVSYFHRSTTAAYILETKQDMLDLPHHSLIIDVATRWNSSYEMVERYLEQQAAIYSALTEKKIKTKGIANLSDQELSYAENIVDVMKPLKMITAVIRTETAPSISMILPLQTTILNATQENTSDAPITREMKNAIGENFKGRYEDPDLRDFLNKCTLLDPRFKTLNHLDPACHRKVHDDIIREVLGRAQQNDLSLSTQEDRPSTSQATPLPVKTEESEVSSSPPPSKGSAMAEIFGSLFRADQRSQPTLNQKLKEEVIVREPWGRTRNFWLKFFFLLYLIDLR
ncbi:zinc finger BED domain-containing protein 4-like [Neoarius graeffei]|uniref:zinc finger BED domain-containing protein 4-like n=1 Tax=Neoarius graeffei TaxID=443677 RepID=UPI00298D5AE0|nr:zinc finger BED domain-containing protein 4-like [Neoarius graeffei]